MTISTIPTVYGVFTINDDLSGNITVSGPASATFQYPYPIATPDSGLHFVWAQTLKSAHDFCLNYSQEFDLHVLKLRGDNENVGIVIRDTCTPCGSVEGLTIHALKESGKLEGVLAQIRSGQTLDGLAGT